MEQQKDFLDILRENNKIATEKINKDNKEKEDYMLNYNKFKQTFEEPIKEILKYYANKGKTSLTVYSIYKDLAYLTIPPLFGKNLPIVRRSDTQYIKMILTELGLKQTITQTKGILDKTEKWISFTWE